METEAEALGVPVTWVGRSGSRSARLREIVRVLRADPPDVIQSAHFYTNLYVGMAGGALGRPSIGAVRSDLTGEIRANRPFGTAQLMMPRYLIANSRLGRERAIEAGRATAHVFFVPNAVDVERFRVADLGAAGRDSRALRLLFVGRMVSLKRPDMFLRLVKNLHQCLPGLRIEARLVGAGPEGPRLQELSDRLGLDRQSVRFEGESDDMAPVYSWADMLVLTSDHEGTPNVILEAMAAGLPVVATAVGGVPDLLAHGGGLLVRSEDEDGLLDAVARLHSDERLRDLLTQEGLRFVRANHSLEGLRQRLLSIYQLVLGR